MAALLPADRQQYGRRVETIDAEKKQVIYILNYILQLFRLLFIVAFRCTAASTPPLRTHLRLRARRLFTWATTYPTIVQRP